MECNFVRGPYLGSHLSPGRSSDLGGDFEINEC